MRRKLFTLLAVLGAASLVSTAKAAEVDYYIVTVTNPTSATSGSWAVYANVTGNDSDGLAYYEIDVLGSGGAVVTGSSSSGEVTQAPSPIDAGDTTDDPFGPGNKQYNDGHGGSMGFNSSFASLGSISAGSRLGIINGQSTVYTGNDDPNRDMGILVGVGQEPAASSPQNGTQGPIDGSGFPVANVANAWTWNAGTTLYPTDPLAYRQLEKGTLIEKGSYTDTGLVPGSLTVQVDPAGYSEVLGTGFPIPPGGASFPGNYPGGSNVPWGYDPYQGGNTPIVPSVGDTVLVGAVAVPEPASIGLIALGMGMMASGRKLRRKAA